MKVVYLITGSGGTFYCANCYRDMLYLRAIRQVQGITAKAVPLYLPPDKSIDDPGFEREVFFGAISMYLRDKTSFFSKLSPKWDKFLDSMPFLKLASKISGSTNANGLEEMTLNMISGDNSFRGYEVDRLLKYLSKDGKPDIIHLSNALIMGLAKHIKSRAKATKVVCSILNEDDWIDDMPEKYRQRAWDAIGKESKHVDRFLTPSNYYKNMFASKTGIDQSKIDVVPIGFDPENRDLTEKHHEELSIGFFCRMNTYNGFDKIVDAFIKLKEENKFPGLMLRACGGFTGTDKPFIAEQLKKLKSHSLINSVKIYNEFTGTKKAEFFNDVDIITVPVRKYDGYGLYILEANSVGIPVVLPATGAFPEIVKNTGGGIVYEPDTVDALVANLTKLLSNTALRKELGEIGAKNVITNLSMEKMTSGIEKTYSALFT